MSTRHGNFTGKIDHDDIVTRLEPGIMPQMVDFLASTKFRHTSFFVDDRRDFTVTYYQTSNPTEETIKDKRVHEAVSESMENASTTSTQKMAS